MKEKKIIITVISIFLTLIIGCTIYFKFIRKDNTVSLKTNQSDNIDDIDFSNYKKYSINLTDSYTIENAGVYTFTGTLNNGSITGDTTDNIKIILDNVSITNESGPAILVENSNVVYIETKDGTTNTLTDGSSFSNEEYDATIYSKDDLVLCGSGTLIINSNYNNAIKSKDDLKIKSGSYEITSIDDGIIAKDSLVIDNGKFTIETKGDAIKATNDADEKLGYILINDGEFNITSTTDAIQAVTDITINNGKFNIKTSNGSSNVSTNSNWGNFTDKNSNESSAKGIKAQNNIVINGGTFNIDSSDDSIHSNNSVKITNGNITINSGDDGIHADSTIIIDNGNINIQKSYEGIEAKEITINNGTINVVASDDGFNGAGGNDSSSIGGRPGENNFSEGGDSTININGGSIYVDSKGDGIDSNGSIYMNGGTVIVNGPTDNGNGALDYNAEFIITDGTLIASGSAGMSQSISSNSSQNGIMINFNSSINSGDVITIKDSNDNEIITYSSSKNYQNLVISTSDLKTGQTYTIYTNGTSSKENTNGLYENGGFSGGTQYQSFTINSIITNIGNTSSMDRGQMQNGQMAPARDENQKMQRR